MHYGLIIGKAAKRLDELREGWLSANEPAVTAHEPRTMTRLYNDRPAWLSLAHHLDRAVLSIYGLADSSTDVEILSHLLKRNFLERPNRGLD